MRVVLPFKLIGQKLVKCRDFPKSIADGSKNTIVVKVDGLPESAVTKAYFKLSWENGTSYDLTFNGSEAVLDEYIVTLPTHANNKYVDYKISMSIAIFDGNEERLTTDPVELVLNKSNYSDETTNTPEIPQSQYDELAAMTADAKNVSVAAGNTATLVNERITNVVLPKLEKAETDVSELNDAVFEMSEVDPSINLFNPEAVKEEKAYINNNTNTPVWLSEPISAKIGDTVYVWVKNDTDQTAVDEYTRFYLYQYDNEGKWKRAKTVTAPTPITNSVTLVAYDELPNGTDYIRVAFQSPNTASTTYSVTEDELANFMVTINETATEFVAYSVGGEVKVDKVKKLQGQVGDLESAVEDLSDAIDDNQEQLDDVDSRVKALEEKPDATIDPEIESDVARLMADVYGEVKEPDEPESPDEPAYLFNSVTDADQYEDGGWNGSGASVADGKKHTPIFDVSGDFTIRVKEFAQNTGVGYTMWVAFWTADKFLRRETLSLYPANEDGTENKGATASTDLRNVENGKFANGAVRTITPDAGVVKATIMNIETAWTLDMKVWNGTTADDPSAGSGGEEEEEDVPRPDNLMDRVALLEEQVDELEDTLENFDPDLPETTYDIVKGNEALVGAVFGNASGDWYKPDLCAVVVNDLHGKFVSLDDAAHLRDTLAPNAIILNAGDNIYHKAKMDGEMNAEAIEYRDKAIQYCVYHTMGQHEVGWNGGWNAASKAGATLKANCMSHDEVFNTFIAPMRSVWGLPNLDTIYYYKDFGKTRLISLYQYNIPLVDDPSDATRYKYDREIVWYGEEQLNWLVNTLRTTPDGYRVVILQHQNEHDVVTGDEPSAFRGWVSDTLSSKTPILSSGASIGVRPVYDIVKAYINKTTFTREYTADRTKYTEDDFTFTINADFTNAKGEFGNYISGDSHLDFVGYLKTSTANPFPKQRHIVVTASGSSSDCFVNPTANNASRSIVTLMGYVYPNDTYKGDAFVRLGRVGQQYSLNGQIRVLEKVTLTKKE